MARRAPRDPRVVGGICFAGFGAVALFALSVGAAKGDPLGWAFGAISAGFAIASLAMFHLGSPDEKGRRRPYPLGWILLLLGMGVMSAGPFVFHAGGIGWGDPLGSGRRSLPLWLLAGLIWAGAISVLVGATRDALSAVRARRERASDARAALPSDPHAAPEQGAGGEERQEHDHDAEGDRRQRDRD